MALRGMMPVLVSPMAEDGSPDEQGYSRLLDYVLEHPVCGFWVLGSASEDFLMSYEHRLRATQTVADYLDGRSHLIVGCADPVLSEVYRFFEDTAGLAVDAYHLLPPGR